MTVYGGQGEGSMILSIQSPPRHERGGQCPAPEIRLEFLR